MKTKKRILEIGSGHGFNAHVLAKDKNVLVTGIDLSKEDILISKKRYSRPEFMVMNAEKMSFKDNYFDVVYAMDILEHVDNLKKVLNETKRVLKKEGRFIVNIPYHQSELWLLKIRPTFHKEIHHVRIFQENELETTLTRMNFRMKKKHKKDFLQHVELYFLFIRKIKSTTQLSIGSWRDTPFTMAIHIILLYCDRSVLKTPLVYFPIWIVTVPIGTMINFIGNLIFPRSVYYEFVKK
jgi:SAM-dependent methyltransferase